MTSIQEAMPKPPRLPMVVSLTFSRTVGGMKMGCLPPLLTYLRSPKGSVLDKLTCPLLPAFFCMAHLPSVILTCVGIPHLYRLLKSGYRTAGRPITLLGIEAHMRESHGHLGTSQWWLRDSDALRKYHAFLEHAHISGFPFASYEYLRRAKSSEPSHTQCV